MGKAEIRNRSGKPTYESRKNFEEYRFSLSKGMPQVTVVDELVAAIMKDKKLKLVILDRVQNLKLSPLLAIKNMIDEGKGLKSIVGSIKNSKNKEVFDQLFSDAIGDREKVFLDALNYHPGLKNVLTNSELFLSSAAKLENKDNLITMPLERDELLAKHFNERCNGLQKKCAKAICTDPQKWEQNHTCVLADH